MVFYDCTNSDNTDVTKYDRVKSVLKESEWRMNMKRNKRLISTVMCLVMVISLTLGLTGCGGKDNAAGSGDSYVYVPQYANLSVDFSDGIRNAVCSNGWF